jgi:hypothetical protein
MRGPHDASCTLSAEVLCHNPPIPCKGGHGLIKKVRDGLKRASRLIPSGCVL